MRLAIIDDSQKDRDSLMSLLTADLKEHNINLMQPIELFHNGDDFLESFHPCKYDVVFLDILMDTPNGIETARKIRMLDNDVRIIFITSSNDYASESYEVHAAGYVLKPFDRKGLQKIRGILSPSGHQQIEYIILPEGTRLILQNIIYTEFYNRHVLIHQKQGGNLRLRISQATIESHLLPYPYFINCFRGIIVNLYEVEQLQADYFIMKNGNQIPVSRRKAAETKTTWSEFLFRKVRQEVMEQ